jgi:hypothetical protein
MLCAAVQQGCVEQEKQQSHNNELLQQPAQPGSADYSSRSLTVVKRERNKDDEVPETEADGREPAAKKPKVEPEAAAS